MKKYPLMLSYITKTALWAGTKLKDDFGKKSDFDTVSESWELSVRKNEMATAENGVAKGLTLKEYFEAAGYDCVSPYFNSADRFPLLVKLIDAEDMLSVQVHPDDNYSSRVEGDSGKTEMWYIVDAKEGATLVYGLADGVSTEDFAAAVREGRIGEVMNHVPVKKGQTYFIPAGMLHAIGAGILVAEIQQNSDITYRVYDFDRVGADGKLRELHVDKALDVTRPYTEDEVSAIRFSNPERAMAGESLASCEFFGAARLSVNEKTDLAVGSDSFLSLICIEGSGVITFDGEKYPFSKGDSYFLPAGMGAFSLDGAATLITSRV